MTINSPSHTWLISNLEEKTLEMKDNGRDENSKLVFFFSFPLLFTVERGYER